MADFTQIIQEINDGINTNGVGAITGAKLNEVLRDMIAAVNAEKQDPLTIDATPTEGSTNPVQSGGVYDIIVTMFSNGCLYGGIVGPNDQPTYGADRRYFYLAETEGIYTHFNNRFVSDVVALFYWSDIVNNWVMSALWPNDRQLADRFSVKADKVTGATAGDLAGLDSEGNLTDSGKSPSDFATAAQGTKADTAYQKPSGGIPKTDLASGVQTSLGKADTAFQKPSGGIPKSDLAAAVQTSLGKADTALQSYTETDPVFSASPAAGITSGDIADWDDKADPIPVVDASTIPASMEPNKLYKYGTLSGDTVFPSLATPTDQSRANVYWWKFTTPASTINVQMPSSITIWNGGQAPTIDPSTTYEITVEDGFGTCIKS